MHAAQATPSDCAYTTALIALKDMAVEHGRDSVTHVLGRFGAAKLSDLDPARFPEVTQACKDYPACVKAVVNAGVSP
ncbi:hypothetical protein FUT69_10280 [Xylella taiwanensis]|uniref:Uncharacterized protein n=1 Tax=Xylella taiwanensis TaxID=1444770 RepID=Z9JKV0_9GAMM|nr:hypothetical protein [Xylella taiwanensis]AXI82898.1 hypothetical protein AB672_02470 [Xylella taiwanensis]EWS78461.1 hypothetical protein AF72_05130 [Xylella taiwanensis]MCD8455916.1 hypothetical protein [Xylella taiwanensis]MCD8458319.1 hypothetical protein [Xylella taiwanensis]MCD8460458.1 hypothetical protein [Xylella taiwanensis]